MQRINININFTNDLVNFNIKEGENKMTVTTYTHKDGLKGFVGKGLVLEDGTSYDDVYHKAVSDYIGIWVVANGIIPAYVVFDDGEPTSFPGLQIEIDIKEVEDITPYWEEAQAVPYSMTKDSIANMVNSPFPHDAIRVVGAHRDMLELLSEVRMMDGTAPSEFVKGEGWTGPLIANIIAIPGKGVRVQLGEASPDWVFGSNHVIHTYGGN